jgi:hypothetical protein
MCGHETDGAGVPAVEGLDADTLEAMGLDPGLRDTAGAPRQDLLETKLRAVAQGASWATVDRLQGLAMRSERGRCAAMLEGYIRAGHKEPEIVAYARALLRADY